MNSIRGFAFLPVCLLCIFAERRLEASPPAAPPSKALPTAQAQAYDIAAYYFPGFHVDPRNEAYLGAGYTEWRNIKAAKPGYDGHFQPRVPLWGYQDEALAAEMEIKIDAAAYHGVTAFIFDWYWYQNKPFLERCLNDGYLKAKNKDRIRFYLMWANHDWEDIFPLGRVGNVGKVWDGEVDRAAFDAAVDHVIKDYLSQPSYYKIDGEPVFSIYELGTLIGGLGGIEAAKSALNSFRAKTKAAGFPGLHLQGVIWGSIRPISLEGQGLSGQASGAEETDRHQLLERVAGRQLSRTGHAVSHGIPGSGPGRLS
jgi:hypothetical protein